MEIPLLDSSVFKCDFRFQRGSQSEDDAAFHLRFDRVRIDGQTAIDRANDAMNAHRAALLHRRFDDLRHVAVERKVRCDSPPYSGRQLRSPLRLLSGQVEHR